MFKPHIKHTLDLENYENNDTNLVRPGVEPIKQALDRFKLLITLLFPTFGKPMIPTVIVCLRSLMRV